MTLRALFICCALSLLAIACGDEDSSNNSGTPDAGIDVGAADTGSTDSGSTDTGPTDTGSPDTGPTDTGSPDTGPTDADSTDTGSPDTGATDTGPTDTGSTDTGPTDAGSPDTGPVDDLYVGSGDPYASGSLGVATFSVDAGPPFPLAGWQPSSPGTYPVVVFVHGFQLQSSYYAATLEHLASHGFIVLAPQLSGGFTGGPTAAEDATSLGQTLDWLQLNLAAQTTGTPSFDHVGLAGHSRGSKVIWTLMTQDASRAGALAGVDPVDGTGGPLGGESRVISGPFGFNPPTLILGTGLGPQANLLGQACAPDGDNYLQFYGASQSPAWEVVATDYGHNDMLDANSGCGLACSACASGPSDAAPMRTLTRGVLTAFFRGSLQGDTSSYATLTDTAAAPATITAQSK